MCCGLCLLLNLQYFRWLAFVVFHDQAGGSPAARHFLLLRQNKVTQEKATRSLGPFGQPALRQKSGGPRKLACGSNSARP